MGRIYTITPAEVNTITVAGDKLLVPANATVRDVAYWIASETARILNLRLPYYASLMNLSYRSAKLSSAQRQWGSCNVRNDLHFSRNLSMCTPEAIDYVVIHELSHIPHKDHSADFYRFVSRFMPDYKKQEKWLKENRGILDI